MTTIERIKLLVENGKIEPPDRETETSLDWETVIHGVYYKIAENKWSFFSYFSVKQLTEEEAFRALMLLKELKDILKMDHPILDILDEQAQEGNERII